MKPTDYVGYLAAFKLTSVNMLQQQLVQQDNNPVTAKILLFLKTHHFQNSWYLESFSAKRDSSLSCCEFPILPNKNPQKKKKPFFFSSRHIYSYSQLFGIIYSSRQKKQQESLGI